MTTTETTTDAPPPVVRRWADVSTAAALETLADVLTVLAHRGHGVDTTEVRAIPTEHADVRPDRDDPQCWQAVYWDEYSALDAGEAHGCGCCGRRAHTDQGSDPLPRQD